MHPLNQMRDNTQGRPNHPAADKAGITPRLTIERHWAGLPEPGR